MRILEDGSDVGIHFGNRVQPGSDGLVQEFIICEEFSGNSSVCLVLRDKMFYDQGSGPMLRNAASQQSRATLIDYMVKDPEHFGAAAFGENMRAVSNEGKPKYPYLMKP